MTRLSLIDAPCLSTGHYCNLLAYGKRLGLARYGSLRVLSSASDVVSVDDRRALASQCLAWDGDGMAGRGGFTSTFQDLLSARSMFEVQSLSIANGVC